MVRSPSAKHFQNYVMNKVGAHGGNGSRVHSALSPNANTAKAADLIDEVAEQAQSIEEPEVPNDSQAPPSAE
jgi:hypothetical protein